MVDGSETVTDHERTMRSQDVGGETSSTRRSSDTDSNRESALRVPSPKSDGERSHPELGEHTTLLSSTSTEIAEDRRDTDHAVSVILPTYNEAQHIVSVVERVRKALDGYEREIIVVDDDSPDRTWEVVQDQYQEVGEVRVIRRTEQRGLATALMRGFTEAIHDYCVVIDADLQHPPEKLPDLLTAFEDDVDVVIGSRYVPEGAIKQWSPYRKFVSRCATVLARLCLPSVREVRDPLSGFFAVRRDVLEFEILEPIGYKLLLEVLVKSDVGSITEVPYAFTDRTEGDSNLTIEEYINFLRHVYRLAHHELKQRSIWERWTQKRTHSSR